MPKRGLLTIERKLVREEHILVHIFRGAYKALLIIFLALLIGTLSFMKIENINFYDAVYQTAMIITGMGPAITLKTNAAKIFASVFALISIGVVISAIAFVFGPIYKKWYKNTHKELQKEIKNK